MRLGNFIIFDPGQIFSQSVIDLDRRLKPKVSRALAGIRLAEEDISESGRQILDANLNACQLLQPISKVFNFDLISAANVKYILHAFLNATAMLAEATSRTLIKSRVCKPSP